MFTTSFNQEREDIDCCNKEVHGEGICSFYGETEIKLVVSQHEHQHILFALKTIDFVLCV